jgi:hypothetical protein
MYLVCISDPATAKLKLATLILEFGTAKPSCVIPMGRTREGIYCTNIQLVRTGLVRTVDCEHGDRRD